MRREPQLSLSLGLLFPETEGGLPGYITGHDTEFSRSKTTRTEQGRDAEAELHNANPHQEQDPTSGCFWLHIWAGIWGAHSKNSSGDFDQQWEPLDQCLKNDQCLKKIEKKKVTQSGITLRAQGKNIYIFMVLRSYRNCHDYRTLGLYYVLHIMYGI